MKNFKKILGGALVALPFIGMFIFFVQVEGLIAASIVFGSVFAIAATILVGTWLLTNN